jgi:acetylornithine deacetylase
MVNNGITADMAVIPEPTSNRISIASGGYLFFELMTRGNPGATYRRGGTTVRVQPGEDAIEKMLKAIPALKSWGESYVHQTRYHGEPAGHVNIIAIEGGHPFRASKLPCFCRLYMEVGHMPGQLHGDIIAQVAKVTRELQAKDPQMEIELQVVQSAHAAEISPDEYVVKSVVAAHEGVWGERPEITWDGWYADTAPLTRAGIPAICYGPQGRIRGGGTGYYPKEGEQVHVGDLTKGTRVFINVALDVCLKERGSVHAPNAMGTVVR